MEVEVTSDLGQQIAVNDMGPYDVTASFTSFDSGEQFFERRLGHSAKASGQTRLVQRGANDFSHVLPELGAAMNHRIFKFNLTVVGMNRN